MKMLGTTCPDKNTIYSAEISDKAEVFYSCQTNET